MQTVANRALLVTYAWPENSAQYRKVAHFVTEFFNKIDCFKESGRHPKWREINLWADIPGWTRFKPAAEWLAAHRAGAAEAPLRQRARVLPVPRQLRQYSRPQTHHEQRNRISNT